MSSSARVSGRIKAHTRPLFSYMSCRWSMRGVARSDRATRNDHLARRLPTRRKHRVSGDRSFKINCVKNKWLQQERVCRAGFSCRSALGAVNPARHRMLCTFSFCPFVGSDCVEQGWPTRGLRAPGSHPRTTWVARKPVLKIEQLNELLHHFSFIQPCWRSSV